MNDPVLEAVNAFMDAVGARMESMNKEITELRGAVAIQTRAVEPVAGPAGKDGRDGKDGAPGPKGDTGAAGERGADGVQGRDGKDGMAGRDGAPGVTGTPGEKGERGADGIATLADLDARVEARFADVQARTFADVYQGVYENGKLYTRGLLATWGGSLWLSQTETRAKPGEGTDWKLVVKRGADGKK